MLIFKLPKELDSAGSAVNHLTCEMNVALMYLSQMTH